MTDEPQNPRRRWWRWTAAGLCVATALALAVRAKPITAKAEAVRVGMTSEQVAAILGWHRIHLEGDADDPVHIEAFTGETSVDYFINEIVVEFGWYRFPRTLEKCPVVVHYDAQGLVKRVEIH